VRHTFGHESVQVLQLCSSMSGYSSYSNLTRHLYLNSLFVFSLLNYSSDQFIVAEHHTCHVLAVVISVEWLVVHNWVSWSGLNDSIHRVMWHYVYLIVKSLPYSWANGECSVGLPRWSPLCSFCISDVNHASLSLRFITDRFSSGAISRTRPKHTALCRIIICRDTAPTRMRTVTWHCLPEVDTASGPPRWHRRFICASPSRWSVTDRRTACSLHQWHASNYGVVWKAGSRINHESSMTSSTKKSSVCYYTNW